MKRKTHLKTRALLVQMYRSALQNRSFPRVFERAIDVMVDGGLHPEVFRHASQLRKIVIDLRMREADHLGVYIGNFCGRREEHFGDNDIDWTKYGWDQGLHFMAYQSEFIDLWVAVHEFGHYVDDIFLCQSIGWFSYLGCERERIKRFMALRTCMGLEYEYHHNRAWKAVPISYRMSHKWWHEIPRQCLPAAPTKYGLYNLSEWIAESFRCYFLEDREAFAMRCPATFEFMNYALSGQIFRRQRPPVPTSYFSHVEEDEQEDIQEAAITYARSNPVLYREGPDYQPYASSIEKDGKIYIQPWPEGSITVTVIEETVTPFIEKRFTCPPE